MSDIVPFLLIDRYAGIGATFEQACEFFKISNITVITHADVEAVSLPQIDKEFVRKRTDSSEA